MPTVETAVNGFGRIGAVYARIAIDDPTLEVLAINNGNYDVHDAASRLKFDSVHRDFEGHEVKETADAILVDEKRIAVYGFRDLAIAPWKEVSDKLVVVDSTGAHLDRESAGQHLTAGAQRVVLTSPAKDETIPTIVQGVNDTEENLAAVDGIVAVSSCSTNCIAPIMKVLSNEFEVEWGSADIPHAFTSSQRSLDGSGQSIAARRGVNSIIPAKTGSAKEVARLFPDLEFFHAESMRVPVQDGSVAMLTVGLRGAVTAKNVIECITAAAQTTHKEIIGVSEDSMYAEKVLGKSTSSVIDPKMISAYPVSSGTIVKLQAWFDNEWGYASRVAQLAKRVGQFLD